MQRGRQQTSRLADFSPQLQEQLRAAVELQRRPVPGGGQVDLVVLRPGAVLAYSCSRDYP